MMGTIELRLAELHQEQEKAQQVLVDLDQQRLGVTQTYWRIAGAITVLEELRALATQREVTGHDLGGSPNGCTDVAAGSRAASD